MTTLPVSAPEAAAPVYLSSDQMAYAIISGAAYSKMYADAERINALSSEERAKEIPSFSFTVKPHSNLRGVGTFLTTTVLGTLLCGSMTHGVMDTVSYIPPVIGGYLLGSFLTLLDHSLNHDAMKQERLEFSAYQHKLSMERLEEDFALINAGIKHGIVKPVDPMRLMEPALFERLSDAVLPDR